MDFLRVLKVAEHSFQEPMLNPPLLLNYLNALAPDFYFCTERSKLKEKVTPKSGFFCHHQ